VLCSCAAVDTMCLRSVRADRGGSGMLTKGFVLIGVLLSVGASWGVATLASSRTASAPTSAATGVPGIAGTNGNNGNDGKAGTDGAAGALGLVGAQGPAGTNGAAGALGLVGAQGPAGTNGAAGALGPVGAQGHAGTNGAAGALGLVGAQGPAGPMGPSGASAPTFFATSVQGEIDTIGYFYLPAQTAAVPAGPALVGFSVALQYAPIGLPGGYPPVTCSLVDANIPTTVLATSSSLAPLDGRAGPDYTNFTASQVVNLTAPTVLAVQCISFGSGPIKYQSPSVYAISFAP
jgi:hypothetical protein